MTKKSLVSPPFICPTVHDTCVKPGEGVLEEQTGLMAPTLTTLSYVAGAPADTKVELVTRT
jgi:hypothetical protein